MEYKEDKGQQFGTWNDEVTKLMYYTSTQEILEKIDHSGKVIDLGGGNGLLKKFVSKAVTVDIDESKCPDVVADIKEYHADCDLIMLRYVLHYLNDYEVLQLIEHINSYHNNHVLIQQFVNDDLVGKYKNSKNEFKYFRCEAQLNALLKPLSVKKIYECEYTVTADFYKNRLGFENGTSHKEKIIAFYK